MAKQSILGRIAQLAKANINALLDSAEDPEKMLNQMERDFKNSIVDAESSVAQTIGNLRLMEADLEEDRRAVTEWGSKAAAASSQAEKLRASGDAADADRFDNLARVALSKQISFEKEVATAEPSVTAQQQVVDQLKTGLQTMREKLVQLQAKRDELVSRGKVADAQSQVQDAVKNLDVLDPTSELGRFEEKVKRQEAMVRGQAELAASTLDAQFNELDDLGSLSEVDLRLQALKQGGN
ncbi:PspA/IM30 family protein [Leucobacter luti]|uniref:Phage shock protein A (PspA) family protein n=1 Tax=Leucobacter luti TaxID=340320 RepID=A0A4R6RVK9_9MICO|nr:PspA/IM30 family protein [Leucobacter luti]MCW2289661.1 phage shock protein A [Leucobacter luti]QYM77168.1 PspA/IM30 family protein [Leucobacter luti]TCK37832.1 phage shock protein A (PspA) family protein [Leucobacter luti]TDP90824.1 phage shock protein A (PspA) family protein [Leucobacter luti]